MKCLGVDTIGSRAVLKSKCQAHSRKLDILHAWNDLLTGSALVLLIAAVEAVNKLDLRFSAIVDI